MGNVGRQTVKTRSISIHDAYTGRKELLAHFTHALVTTLRIDINLLNRLRIQLQTSGDSMKARQHNGAGLGANPRWTAAFRAVGSFAAEIFAAAAAAADAP